MALSLSVNMIPSQIVLLRYAVMFHLQLNKKIAMLFLVVLITIVRAMLLEHATHTLLLEQLLLVRQLNDYFAKIVLILLEHIAHLLLEALVQHVQIQLLIVQPLQEVILILVVYLD